MNYRFPVALVLAIFLLPISSCVSSEFADITVVTTPTQQIPSTFMGFSHEWTTSQQMMGSSENKVDSIYRQLLKNLTAYGSGPIVIRIGGESVERSGEPTSTTVLPFAELANSLGTRFSLSVKFGGSLKLATDQASAFVSQMPAGSLDAIEIGNESDMNNDYKFEDYLTRFNQWKDNILPLLPLGMKLMGPSWAKVKSLSNADAFIGDDSSYLFAFSQHNYAAGYTSDLSDDFLLSPGAAKDGASSVASAVRYSHLHGIPFRMGEMNSISGGGRTGFSDTFQSALWAIDTMFYYVSVGVDGVNWHTGCTAVYDAFRINCENPVASNTYTLESVRPVYYGLLVFQAATGNGARLLPLEMHKDSRVSAWATVDSAGVIRVVLLDKSLHRSGVAHITLAGFAHATIYRLTAPNYRSTAGIAFAGQTFDGSEDGTIQGQQVTETVDATKAGAFDIPMDPVSAALIVFEK